MLTRLDVPVSRPSRLRVAVLCSHRAPGLDHLLDHDPDRGVLYDLAGCITSEPDCKEVARLRAVGVPVAVHDLHAFYGDRGARITDLDVRGEYDRVTLARLDSLGADLVVLSSYLYVLTSVLLAAFPGRVLNLHDSDLCRPGPDRRPRFRGLRSTLDALVAGELETRSTLHVVTEEVDVGPAVLRSRGFPVPRELVDFARARGDRDILKACAYAQREWMMRTSWGPLLSTAIELYAHDRVRVQGDRVFIDGASAPLDLESDAAAPAGAGAGSRGG